MASTYSKTRVLLHWAIALLIIALFASGYWMVELNYYDAWYTKAPHYHKSFGLLLILFLIAACVVRIRTAKPNYEKSLSDFEKKSAKAVQMTMSFLAFFICITGYLMVTANGDPVSLFNWLDVPATLKDVKNQEDITGKYHRWAAYLILGLAIMHAAVALFHHFFKKDRTLLKMLGK